MVYKRLCFITITFTITINTPSLKQRRPVSASACSSLAPVRVPHSLVKMHYTNPLALLGLATTAVAIDISLWWNCDDDCAPTACSGIPAFCRGANPNYCCWVPDLLPPADDIGFQFIPTNWRLSLWSFAEKGCTPLSVNDFTTSHGRTTVCLRNGGLKNSGLYLFDNTRTDGESREEGMRALQAGCEGSQMINVLGLVDGTEYDVAGLEDAAILEL